MLFLNRGRSDKKEVVFYDLKCENDTQIVVSKKGDKSFLSSSQKKISFLLQILHMILYFRLNWRERALKL